MTTTNKKIVVFSATGEQGRSVCQYLLEAGWHVVGISRDPSSEASKRLAHLGVQVVRGAMDDPPSYQPALRDAYGAYINVDFWATYLSTGSPSFAVEKEIKQSKAIVDSCLRAGLKHVVYSALDDLKSQPGFEGEGVPHLDSKAEVTRYIKSTTLPTTVLHTSYYFSNCVRYSQIVKDEQGDLTFTCPAPDDTILPCYAVEQTGKWVVEAFKTPERWIGKDMQAAGEALSIAQTAQVISQVVNKPVKTLHMTLEQFMSADHKERLGEPVWLNYLMNINKRQIRDVAASKAVVPDQWDCLAWARQDPGLRQFVEEA